MAAGPRLSSACTTSALTSSAAEAAAKVGPGPSERSQARAGGAAAPTRAPALVSTEAASGSAPGRACRPRSDSAGARNTAIDSAQAMRSAGTSVAGPGRALTAATGSARKRKLLSSTPPITRKKRRNIPVRARSDRAPVSGSIIPPTSPSTMRSTVAR